MHTGLEEQGNAGLARLAAFYAERARGGCSLMVTGGFSPNPEGRLGGPARLGSRVLSSSMTRGMASTGAVLVGVENEG